MYCQPFWGYFNIGIQDRDTIFTLRQKSECVIDAEITLNMLNAQWLMVRYLLSTEQACLMDQVHL